MRDFIAIMKNLQELSVIFVRCLFLGNGLFTRELGKRSILARKTWNFDISIFNFVLFLHNRSYFLSNITTENISWYKDCNFFGVALN